MERGMRGQGAGEAGEAGEAGGAGGQGGQGGIIKIKSLPCLPPLPCLPFLFSMPNAPCQIMLGLVQEFPGEDIRGSDRTMLLPFVYNLGLLCRNLEKAGDR